jgi:S-adenosylmethionine-diacylgycerolhomoserine-N-methlytransferase
MRMNSAERDEHRRFLNRYYGQVRHVYDATRKYYLFGRDSVLDELAGERWQRLVEVGCGTGRNLIKLHARRPEARYGAIDASDEMLEHAGARCPFATLRLGFAEDADLGMLDQAPDRILFSYCLSMVADPAAALANARKALAPGGEVVVIDFGDLESLPRPLKKGLRSFLSSFHVRPLPERLLDGAARRRWGPGRYFVTARFGGTSLS